MKSFAWASPFRECRCFPTDETHVALYLLKLMQSSYSISSIQSAFYAISFFHSWCGVSNLCDSKFLRCIIESCKRVFSTSVRRRGRSPLLPNYLLIKLVSSFASSDATLSHVRDVCLGLVAFSGFFRYDEVRSIRWYDVDFKDHYFPLYIPRGKTDRDQYLEGCTRLVAKTGKPSCPHDRLIRYALLAGEDTCTCSTEIVFRSLDLRPDTHFFSESEKLFWLSLRPSGMTRLVSVCIL